MSTSANAYESAIQRLHEDLEDSTKRQIFGRWLREQRTANDLRQADVAAIAGILSQSMSRAENGITRLGRRHLEMLLTPLRSVDGVQFTWSEDGFTVVDGSGNAVDLSEVFVRPVPVEAAANGESLDDESRFVLARWAKLTRSDRAIVLGLITRLSTDDPA